VLPPEWLRRSYAIIADETWGPWMDCIHGATDVAAIYRARVASITASTTATEAGRCAIRSLRGIPQCDLSRAQSEPGFRANEAGRKISCE